METGVPRGMRDFLPEEMIKRNYVFDTIKKVFESYGFDPLETPIVEKWEVLAAKGGGGEAIKDEIYYFKDKGERELGLRFDLTVPLCRVIANNRSLAKPFKRYAIGRVYRYDEPQFGRYRELWQADVDIVGSNSPEADAEVVAVALECLKKLGFEDFEVRINNRKVINDFFDAIKLDEDEKKNVMRIIDKLDKIGEEGVKKQLENVISKPEIEKIVQFITIKEDIGKIEKLVEKKEGINELRQTIDSLIAMGVEKERLTIDMSLVRGLEYYTGPVFELSVEGGKWSVGGGGRYDRLISVLNGEETPATGISLGVERLIILMEEKKLFKKQKTYTQVFVASVNVENRDVVYGISNELRKEGINTENDISGKNLKKQFDYINNKEIPICIIIGPEEVKQGIATVRNMKDGKEIKVKFENVVEKIKEML